MIWDFMAKIHFILSTWTLLKVKICCSNGCQSTWAFVSLNYSHTNSSVCFCQRLLSNQSSKQLDREDSWPFIGILNSSALDLWAFWVQLLTSLSIKLPILQRVAHLSTYSCTIWRCCFIITLWLFRCNDYINKSKKHIIYMCCQRAVAEVVFIVQRTVGHNSQKSMSVSKMHRLQLTNCIVGYISC